jgi:hypothetical protein
MFEIFVCIVKFSVQTESNFGNKRRLKIIELTKCLLGGIVWLVTDVNSGGGKGDMCGAQITLKL